MVKKKIDILLIEDNKDEAALVMHSLKKCSLAGNCTHINNGTKAVEYIINNGQLHDDNFSKPDIILLDLHLPKMNGFEVLQKLKASEILKLIPVIILTSSGDEEDVKKAYYLGANSYIVKPIDYIEFRNSIIQIATYWGLQNELTTRW